MKGIEDYVFIDSSTTCISVAKYNVLTKRTEHMVLLNHYSISKLEEFDVSKHNCFKGIYDLIDVNIFRRSPISRPKGNPSEYNRIETDSDLRIADVFIQAITTFLDDLDFSTTLLGWEDFPVSVKSNSTIKLVSSATSLKNLLVQEFPLEHMYWFQPQDLKKMAGNGNWNKQQMLEAYIKDAKYPLAQVIGKNAEFYKSGTKNVNHPVEDIVDSYFGLKTLIEFVKTNP